MELRHLRYFIAVAEELHFSRAAKKLHISQPPLSQQIRALEDELKVELFSRTKRRVELTPGGRMFLTEARAIVGRSDAAVAKVKSVQRGESGRLSIGWMPWSDLTALPYMIGRFCERYPGVYLDLHNLSVADQISALQDGKIDIGFVLSRTGPNAPPVAVDGLWTDIVMRQQLAVVLPINHKFATQRHVDLSQLANEPYILFKRESGPMFYDYVIGLFRRHGLSLNIRHEADHPSTVLGLVAAGLGVTILPYTQNRVVPRVVFCSPSPKFEQLEIVVARRPHNESTLIAQFLETICEYRQKSTEIGEFSSHRLQSTPVHGTRGRFQNRSRE